MVPVRMYLILALLPLSAISCRHDATEVSDQEVFEVTDRQFDQELWGIKQGYNYPYREQMLKDVVYDETIRLLKKEQLLEVLGEPDRVQQDYLYYRVTEKRLWFWTLHTKTLVIKLTTEGTVDWIKIHE